MKSREIGARGSTMYLVKSYRLSYRTQSVSLKNDLARAGGPTTCRPFSRFAGVLFDFAVQLKHACWSRSGRQATFTGQPSSTRRMTFPTQYNNLDSRQLYTPPSAPTRHTSRTYTVSRPSSLPVAGLPSRPSTTSRFSFHDAYSSRGVTRSISAAEGTTVSMDDVYAVDDALAKRQSLQPPAYAPGSRLPGYSDDKINPPEKTNDLTSHTRNHSVSSENAEPSQQMSMITRIVIPLLLVLPVLTAMGLSYFGTSQSDSIRGVVDVVHVRLPLAEFRKLQRPKEAAPLVLGPGPLISTPVVSQSQLPAFTLSASQRALGEVGEASATQDVLSVPSAKSQVARRQNRDDSDGGTLAIGLWGWSLTPVDGTS